MHKNAKGHIPGVDQALTSWRQLLGSPFVEVERQKIEVFEKATFHTTQSIWAVIQPGNTEEVRECVRIATKYNVPIYPVSRGRNWGLGSFVPPRTGCTVLDLSRMNRIIQFDEFQGYITVQPGVTFAQVAEFLREKGSARYISVIGGPADASLIGNMVERGDSIGPYGDRFQHCCNLEIVLGTGDAIHTGFGRYGSSSLSNLHRYGVGPFLDGLFTQSNLGIVTQATFWLSPRPAYFQVLLFALRSDEELLNTCDALKELLDRGVIPPFSAMIWNRHKFLAWETQYPWHLTGGKTPLPSPVFEEISGPWRGKNWIGMIGLYSASRRHGRADRALVTKRLKPHAARFIALTPTKARICTLFEAPLRWITKRNIGGIVDTLFNDSVFLGTPTQKSVRGMYWRKRVPIPADPDPERDHCGVLWLCPTVPFATADLSLSIQLMRSHFEKHGFEPLIAMTFPSARSIYFLPAIIYDRDITGEDARALLCHDELLSAFILKQYYPHRLGIQSMNSLPAPTVQFSEFWRRLKDAVDPSGILSPGRYAFPQGPGDDHGNKNGR